MKSNKKLSIFNSTNMPPPSSLEKEILSNRQQPVASNNHMLPLIHQEEVRPKMDPVCSQSNNLQKIESFCLLKIILFQHVHIDQHKAETPIRILALVFLGIPFNQLPNILVILVGGGKLYVK
jgi:hypothetical protein